MVGKALFEASQDKKFTEELDSVVQLYSKFTENQVSDTVKCFIVAATNCQQSPLKVFLQICDLFSETKDARLVNLVERFSEKIDSSSVAMEERLMLREFVFIFYNFALSMKFSSKTRRAIENSFMTSHKKLFENFEETVDFLSACWSGNSVCKMNEMCKIDVKLEYTQLSAICILQNLMDSDLNQQKVIFIFNHIF